VLSFRGILCDGKVSSLRDWVKKAEATAIGVIRAFVRQLKRDMAAVENVVEQVWSNGPVEGHINRLKNLRGKLRASQIRVAQSADTILGDLNTPAPNKRKNQQLALFQERKVKPRRADNSTRWIMATLSRMFEWRGALINVKPDTLIRWHRKGFRLLWRVKSKPTGRPQLAKEVRDLIRRMAVENRTWGEEQIANELKLKLGIRVSPRTVGKYVRRARPAARARSSATMADFRAQPRPRNRGVRLF
jgi:hypothetical protein